VKITLIIDGYNAANAIPLVRRQLKKSLEAARSTIMAMAAEYARRSGYITEFKVVFDGVDKYRKFDKFNLPSGRMKVFSCTGGGDKKIIETVKRCSASGRVVLASNDNYVRNNARAYGASIINAEDITGKKNEKR
jgi:predicted RNA-binding protein with PIN domain